MSVKGFAVFARIDGYPKESCLKGILALKLYKRGIIASKFLGFQNALYHKRTLNFHCC
jgi:hypothetical protein